MKPRIQAQISVVLIMAVFAYGIASSVDVFYSAFFLPEEAANHSHTSHSSYCGFVYKSPDYLHVRALPIINTFRVLVLKTNDSVETVESVNASLIPASVFDDYLFRAPPLA